MRAGTGVATGRVFSEGVVTDGVECERNTGMTPSYILCTREGGDAKWTPVGGCVRAVLVRIWLQTREATLASLHREGTY